MDHHIVKYEVTSYEDGSFTLARVIYERVFITTSKGVVEGRPKLFSKENIDNDGYFNNDMREARITIMGDQDKEVYIKNLISLNKKRYNVVSLETVE